MLDPNQWFLRGSGSGKGNRSGSGSEFVSGFVVKLWKILVKHFYFYVSMLKLKVTTGVSLFSLVIYHRDCWAMIIGRVTSLWPLMSLVGRLVGRSVIISQKVVKLNLHAPHVNYLCPVWLVELCNLLLNAAEEVPWAQQSLGTWTTHCCILRASKN